MSVHLGNTHRYCVQSEFEQSSVILEKWRQSSRLSSSFRTPENLSAVTRPVCSGPTKLNCRCAIGAEPPCRSEHDNCAHHKRAGNGDSLQRLNAVAVEDI